MDPGSSYLIDIGLYALFWLLTAFAAGGETAITALNRIRLQAVIERGGSRSEAIRGLLGDPRRSLATLLILNTISLVGGAATGTLLTFTTADGIEHAATGAALLFLLLLGQFIPKALALRWPERVALLIAQPLDLLATVLGPLVGLFGFFATVGGERPTEMLAREEELRLLVDVGEEEGLIEESEREMIAGIFDLGETVAREVMVPRIDIVAVEASSPLREALDAIIEKGHSRIPVYEDTIDHIIGILYAKDMLPYLRSGETEPSLRDLLRPAYFIPESKAVDDLLTELKRMKVHIAIVVDEYGGTAGLVTIEDLIEEIVGDIQDEYDVEEPMRQTISGRETIWDARVDIDDVNYDLDLDLPTEEGDTLAGLILSQLGRVPQAGDEVRVDGVRLIVLSMTGRRIGKVKLIDERGEAASSGGAGGAAGAETPAASVEPSEDGERWDNPRRVSGTA